MIYLAIRAGGVHRSGQRIAAFSAPVHATFTCLEQLREHGVLSCSFIQSLLNADTACCWVTSNVFSPLAHPGLYSFILFWFLADVPSQCHFHSVWLYYFSRPVLVSEAVCCRVRRRQHIHCSSTKLCIFHGFGCLPPGRLITHTPPPI